MNTITIELIAEEVNEFRALLREVTEKMRQANERMTQQDEEFDRYQKEAEAVLARMGHGERHVERAS